MGICIFRRFCARLVMPPPKINLKRKKCKDIIRVSSADFVQTHSNTHSVARVQECEKERERERKRESEKERLRKQQ